MAMALIPLKPWRTRHPATAPGDSSLGTVTMLGTLLRSRGAGMDRMRVWGQWAFVYLVEGRGFYEDANGCRRELETGHWILVFPELAHRYGPRPGQRWNEFYLCFRGPIFDAWREAGILDASRPVGSLKPVSVWWKHFAGMVEEMGNGTLSALEALTLWQAWLGKIMARHEMPKSPAARWLERSGRLLEERLGDRGFGGREVAGQLGMGYENFRKKFSLHMGVSPARYRERLRVERAAQLLRGKKLSNKELAEMLGYCDEAHFSKAFTRMKGESPRAFSRQP